MIGKGEGGREHESPVTQLRRNMPRVKPVTAKSELSAEHQAVGEAVEKFYGRIRGPWGMLLHSPKLAARILPLVPFFHDESIVEGKLRSIPILVVVRELEAEYVWAAQVAAARRNGVREELIDLIRAKGDPAKLPAEEREIVNYARQLARTNRVDQATFDALKNRGVRIGLAHSNRARAPVTSPRGPEAWKSASGTSQTR